ncbi:post-GPI attachment to proteins factor 2-like [Babylonia areolata]|uniref:post-GPI attachment to proteins factor 2-like n=1 Tax=Babylonia areolata TaxID=304850 RepID=UPI003FD0A6A0
MGREEGPLISERILLRVHFWPFAIATVTLPSVSLAICFVTAFLFRSGDINETMCEVQNFIPSISAVTGITPQAYLWRIGIALHSAPRLIVCFLIYNRYAQRVAMVTEGRRGLFGVLLRLNFWLSVVENLALICVTFISNRENYPVHEKLFIVFMVASLCYMLCNIICFTMSCEAPMTEDEARSIFWKKALFVTTISATAGLIYFYLRHRLFCEPGAFSYFSLCEYVIAYASKAYHFTAYIEFKHHEWLVACPSVRAIGATTSDNNNLLRGADASPSPTLSRPSDGTAVKSKKLL